MQIRHHLQQSSLAIADALNLPITEATIEARVLLQWVLECNHAWLISHQQTLLTPHQFALYQKYLVRRISGEPIAYLIGHKEFYGLRIQVSPATLIPRSDTELLVEQALQHIPDYASLHVADLGTGSGAIAVALAFHRPHSKLTAVDNSEAALAVAKQNASRHQLRNIDFVQSDWFTGLTERQFDIIVSNPPYIASDDHHVQQGDLRFEPLQALVSGEDGLQAIRQILAHARSHLKPHGKVLLEHGWDQAHQIQTYANSLGYHKVSVFQDIAGRDRVSVLE